MAQKNASEKLRQQQNKATAKYLSNNYDNISLKVRKDSGYKEQIENHCKEYGYVSDVTGKIDKTAFLLKAIETQMKIDSGEISII